MDSKVKVMGGQQSRRVEDTSAGEPESWMNRVAVKPSENVRIENTSNNTCLFLGQRFRHVLATLVLSIKDTAVMMCDSLVHLRAIFYSPEGATCIVLFRFGLVSLQVYRPLIDMIDPTSARSVPVWLSCFRSTIFPVGVDMFNGTTATC